MSDEDIWSAYANTRVTIDGPDGTLIVTPSDGGDGTLAEVWHVITAHNPRSVMLTADENKRLQDELLRVIRESGRDLVWAAGQGLDCAWPPEESAAVPAIDTAAAVEIVREFGQLAVFRVGPDPIEVIDCGTAEVRSSRPMDVLTTERREDAWDS